MPPFCNCCLGWARITTCKGFCAQACCVCKVISHCPSTEGCQPDWTLPCTKGASQASVRNLFPANILDSVIGAYTPSICHSVPP